jgi:hypothetical protein
MHISSLIEHGITLGSKGIEKVGSEHLGVPLGATDIIWSTVSFYQDLPDVRFEPVLIRRPIVARTGRNIGVGGTVETKANKSKQTLLREYSAHNWQRKAQGLSVGSPFTLIGAIDLQDIDRSVSFTEAL